jgi:uncharacterized protein YgiB involved in biofilm formation
VKGLLNSDADVVLIVQVCNQVERQECYNVPRQVERQECKEIPRQVARQECKNVPRQVPAQKCTNIPRQVSQTKPKNINFIVTAFSVGKFVRTDSVRAENDIYYNMFLILK